MNKKKKILLIEDYHETAEMISTLLKQDGFDVAVEYDGPSGLEKAVSYKPDLILLDVLMPEMNGIEVCKKLKADSKTSKTPIIFVTVKPIEEVKSSKGIGADAYIKKPFDPDHLIEIVNVILKKHAG